MAASQGLITSVCKSDTSPTLLHLGTSWPESGLSSSVANCPLEGKRQQAAAAVAWRSAGNVHRKTGKSRLSLCCFTAVCPSHSSGSPGWHRGSLRTRRSVWRRWWRPEAQTCPLAGPLLEAAGQACQGRPSCPGRSRPVGSAQVQQSRWDLLCPRAGAGHGALCPGTDSTLFVSLSYSSRPQVTLQRRRTQHGRLWMLCSSLFSNILVVFQEHLGFCLFNRKSTEQLASPVCWFNEDCISTVCKQTLSCVF